MDRVRFETNIVQCLVVLLYFVIMVLPDRFLFIESCLGFFQFFIFEPAKCFLFAMVLSLFDQLPRPDFLFDLKLFGSELAMALNSLPFGLDQLVG